MMTHIIQDVPATERSRHIRTLIRQGRIVFGGNRNLKIYGLLTCKSGKKMKPVNRVFFSSEQEAIEAGYRPCGHCMKDKYLIWKSSPPVNILPARGEAYFYPALFSGSEADSLFSALIHEIPWQQQPIKIFGKEVMQPRLTAWYGDAGISYSYSGITLQPLTWTDKLHIIRRKAEIAAGVTFTGALLNLYRDGKDSMGWHRDNEKELGTNPVIGSVSFGATRQFQLRSYADKSKPISIDLTHGSFLLMKGETQHYWEHRVAKKEGITEARINITFRVL
jgi:alkylated DNA repair dioxygenase AlkB